LWYHLFITSFLFLDIRKILGGDLYILQVVKELGWELCPTFVYLIAKRFNRYVGLGAVLILASFSWFWLRARQADLDLILIFFLLASYYLSLLCKKDKRFLILFSIVTALMLQVKTIIGLFLLPVLMLNLIESKALKDKKILFMSIFMFIFLTVFWYGYNFYHYGFAFIRQNIFNIGLRMSEKSIPFLKSFNLSKTSEYLQYSLLKWYKPVVISFFISYFFFTNKILRNLHYWIYPFLIAFLFGPEPGIWHLMPIYPPLAIIASCVLYKIIAFFVKIIKIDNLFRPLFLLTFISFLFVLNTYHLYDDIVLRKGESNEAFLSKMASRLNGTLFIQDDYWPVAVFYSGRKTIRIVEPDKKYYSIKAVFENSERPFQILAKRNDFNDMDKYKVIVQKEDRVLVGVE